MDEVPHCASINIRRHPTKFSRPTDLTSVIFAPLVGNIKYAVRVGTRVEKVRYDWPAASKVEIGGADKNTHTHTHMAISKPSFASLRKKSLVENTLVFSYKDQLFRITCRNNCYCSDSNVKHIQVNTLCG
jgi:hypothetical protein